MRKFPTVMILSVVLLIIVMFVSYTLGIADIEPTDAAKLLAYKLFGLNSVDISALKPSQITILFELRLPRVLVAAGTGMSLAVVGAVFQGLFQNRLADPYILGISSGASLGASIALALGVSRFFFVFSSVSIFATVGSLITVVFVITIYMFSTKKSSTLLLTGISAGYFAAGISTLIIALNTDKIKVITMWAMGSFSGSNFEKAATVLPVCVLLVAVTMFFAKDLNAIATGEESAMSFGVPVGFIRILLVIIGTVLTAFAVAVSGVIGFVGLVVPNGVRYFTGPDYKKLLPASAVFGAIFTLLCDTVARTLFSPFEVPVGAITALIGTPVFIGIILKGRRQA